MGEAGPETSVEHISVSLLEREKAIKDAIDRGDHEIGLYGFGVGPALGLGPAICDHWGRIYWHRPELRKLVKIYDPTLERCERVDGSLAKQLSKSMELNARIKNALRDIRGGLTKDSALGQALDTVLGWS